MDEDSKYAFVVWGRPSALVYSGRSLQPGCGDQNLESLIFTGPKGQKRTADVIGNAVLVIKIAAGEIEEGAPIDDGKDPHVKAMGAKGSAARAKAMSPKWRAEVAKAAAAKRWKKD